MDLSKLRTERKHRKLLPDLRHGTERNCPSPSGTGADSRTDISPNIDAGTSADGKSTPGADSG